MAGDRRAVVLGGNRIPFAKAGKTYHDLSNQDLLIAALNGLIARYGLQGERIGEVAAGAVLKHPRDFGLAREAVLGTSLDPTTPALDLQRACATGLEAVMSVANKIVLGQIEVGIAGGADSASTGPVTVTEHLRAALADAATARSVPARLAAFARIRPWDLKPVVPDVAEARTGLSMGEHQAITTAEWGISREEQDRVALTSHQRLAAAYDTGFFSDLITPLRGLAEDQILRRDTSIDKLAALKPVFGTHLPEVEATMTAGNSTALSDGASTVLIASDTWAQQHGLTPRAVIVDAEVAAVDFVHGRDGLLMAPVYAVPRLLARHGLSLGDFAFIEIHEAFASTVCTTLKAWSDADFCRDRLGLDSPLGTIDPSRINVHGSSLATGHPFAATGGRIVATLAELLARNGGRGLISICAAGGQGVAAILEAA